MKNHLIIGMGQVGKALLQVLNCEFVGHATPYLVHYRDIDLHPDHPPFLGDYDVLHITFPYSEDFSHVVGLYDKQYEPKMTIIHSTVPVGTTYGLGPSTVVSPIRGVHPTLGPSIIAFTKYFGGEMAFEAANLFVKVGCHKISHHKDSRSVEALKLWSTTQHAWAIMMEKIIHKWCKDNDVDFDLVYTDANNTYNAGYTDMDMRHVRRPVLEHMPGPIGGHCLLPNLEMLDGEAAEILLEMNKDFNDE